MTKNNCYNKILDTLYFILKNNHFLKLIFAGSMIILNHYFFIMLQELVPYAMYIKINYSEYGYQLN